MDFKELRRKHARPDPIDPEEIFRRKPKPPGIDDLYSSQAEVLRHWFKHRTQRDTVIKLHTGGGKTLVGLLIGQSVINEIHEPVLYLVPNLQLVDQVLAKAHAYSIPAVQYERGEGLPDVFLNGNSILVCTYAALFNGKSRFGVRGGNRPITKVACVIVDDAHVGALDIRDQFTLKLERSKNPELYEELTHTFRRDFEQIDKLGTFDDVVEGADYNILEVPYWSWSAEQQAVREMLRHSDELVWPLIRDMLDYCHAFITSSAVVVTPLLPPTDMIPTFAECPRRVFMSATIRDDSAVVRAFEVDFTSIQAPLTSKSLAGVSERMILAPDLMSLKGDLSSMVRGMVQRMSQSLSVVVLVPSAKLAGNWEQLGSYLDSSERVQSAVAELQKGQSRGVYIFANRYDGIDLPGDACRLLVVDGLPQGMNVYDAFRTNVLSGGTAVNTIQAQRIEQGIGRAGRGVGDYCVVLITGKDLVAWISQTANQRLLTTATRAQVDTGLEVTKHVVSEQDLWDTVQRCMTRDQDWIEYHAEALADGTEAEDHLGTLLDLKTATLERQVFRLLRDGHHDKAIRLINTFCAPSEGAVLPDRQTVGWVK